jgi:hypothetical protein
MTSDEDTKIAEKLGITVEELYTWLDSSKQEFTPAQLEWAQQRADSL